MISKAIDSFPQRSGSALFGHLFGVRIDPRIAGRRVVAGGLALVLVFGPTLSWAAPQGGKVVKGKAEITTGPNLTVTQKSKRAIIEWNGFSVGSNESVKFIQPSAEAVTLNRVIGKDPSNILGSLTANGGVTLVNPNGIYFARSANVNVGSLIAATANISNKDFMDGRDRFLEPGLASSYVVNQGEITVGREVPQPDGGTIREGGLVAFVAPWVVNSGTINARLGMVEFASGNTFTIDLYGDRLVQLEVKPTIMAAAFGLDGVEDPNALVTVAKEGVIKADGGQVILDAGTIRDVGALSLDVASARSIVDNAINMEGLIEARTVDTSTGKIVLRGGNVGPVRVAGTLDASGPASGQGGGEIVFEGTFPPVIADQAVVEVSGAGTDGTVEAEVPFQEPALLAALAEPTEELGLGLRGRALRSLQDRVDQWLGKGAVTLAEGNRQGVGGDIQSTATVTLIAEDAGFAHANPFGLYDAKNVKDVKDFKAENKIELFTADAKPGARATFVVARDGTVTATRSDGKVIEKKFASRDFGYYLETPEKDGGGLFFSDTNLNPDSNTRTIHVGSYDVGNLTYANASEVPASLQGEKQPVASRLLLWEDLNVQGLRAPEPDYNDFIVNVRAPGDPPPPECMEGSCVPPPVLPCVLDPLRCVEVLPDPADPTSTREEDPWDKCESWRDDTAKADIDIARCYAALTLETLGAHAGTAFAELSAVLADPSPQNRARAARDLGRISASLSAAMPVLVSVLAAPDEGVSAQAAAIMQDAREYADLVVPVLDKAANDEEVVVARAALQGLGELGSYGTKALPTFTRAFEREDRDLGVRYYAANSFSEVDREMRDTAVAIEQVSAAAGNQSLVREFETVLLEDRSELRRPAIETLAEIGPDARGASQGSIDRLGNPDPKVREDAVGELGDINRFAAASVPVLVEALTDPANQELRQDLTIPGEGPSSYVEVAVEPLLGALNDRQPEVRRATAQSLGQLNAVTAEAALALRAVPRGDYDRIVRPITARTLSAIDEYDDRATERLLAALKDDDPAVGRAAAQALGALGPEASGAVPALIAAVKSGETGLQVEAELALGRIGDASEETVSTLVDALQNSDEPAVRYQAARALGLLGEQAQAAIPELRGAMNEGDAGLRYQASLALWSIDPATAIDSSDLDESKEQTEKEVAEMLADIKGEDPSARMTLASIGPAAISAIPNVVADLTAAAPERRGDLASLLSSISSDGLAEVPILIEVLQSPSGEPAARARAARRLGNISADAKKAVPALTEGLKNEDLSVRFALAEALGDIGHHTTATTRALVAAAGSDTSSQVRREATESLRREARAALEAEGGILTRGRLYEIDPALTN